MRMTLRRFSSEKNEGFSLIGLPGNSSLRPMLCSVDRRSALAATDQPEGPASRCRDYQTRFVTTRTPSLSRRARRKLAQLDSPGLGRGRSGRPKPHPRPFDLRARIAQRQVRNAGSSRPVPIALRVTLFRYRRVELQPALASDGWKRLTVAILLICAQPRQLRQVCPHTRECGPGWFAAHSQADPILLPAEPASRPHRVCRRTQSLAPADRSRSDSRAKVL